MKYEKAFADLKKLILKADEKKLEGEFAFQFCIEGDAEGTFYAEFKNGTLAVEPYDYADNTATFKASYAVFKELLSGKTAPADAVANGSLKVEGNEPGCADIFAFISGKKTTAKKAAPAKTEEKPAAKKAPAKKAAPAKAEVKAAPAKTEVKAAPKAEKKAAPVKTEAKAAPKAEVKAAPAKTEVKAEKKAAPAKADTKAAKGKPGRKKSK